MRTIAYHKPRRKTGAFCLKACHRRRRDVAYNWPLPIRISSEVRVIGPELERKSKQQSPSVEVIAADTPVYVRLDCSGEQRIELLRCARFDRAEMTAILEWLADDNCVDIPAPQPPQSVQCYVSREGMVYEIESELVRVEATRPCLMAVKIAPQANAYRLRQHERYQVWGRLRLGETGESDYFYHNIDPLPLNVSFGGFGLQISSVGWKIGDQVRFSLEAYLDIEGEPGWRRPVLRLRGDAVLRSRVPVAGSDDKEHLGFKFLNLAEYQVAALRLWLATNQVCRRY